MSTEMICPNDPRNPFLLMSRREVRMVLKANNIAHEPGIKHTDGVKLLEANKINPLEYLDWERVPVPKEDGSTEIQLHPRRKQPSMSEEDELRRETEMESRLEAAKKNEAAAKVEVKDLTQEMAKLAEANKQLTELVLGMRAELQEKAVSDKQKDVSHETPDLNTMHWKSFQKLAKEAGIEWTSKDPRAPVIEKLNG